MAIYPVMISNNWTVVNVAEASSECLAGFREIVTGT